MPKLDLEKTEEPETKLPTFAESYKKLGSLKKKLKKTTFVSSAVSKPLIL